MEISQQIAGIDLPQILENEGVELHRSGGNGYQFLCPFHDDRHPV